MGIAAHKILIVDAAYQPHNWATVEDSIVLSYKNLISHEIGEESTFRGGISRRSNERSQINIGEIVFLKDVLKYDSRIPPLTNANLFARDMCICAYCARRYPEHKLSRDHIVPVSKGGKNTWTNCTTSCIACNNAKSDKFLHDATDSDGNKMELMYVPYVPNHAERLILSNRRILANQLAFLQEMLPAHSRFRNAHSILGLH